MWPGSRSSAAFRAGEEENPDRPRPHQAGAIFGFLGPNGSGKTTTIRLLLGLLEPTSGTATVLGHDARTDPGAIRDRCGALLEYSGLYERMTAQDNLEFYARVWHLRPAERRERVRDLLTGLGLWIGGARSWGRGAGA